MKTIITGVVVYLLVAFGLGWMFAIPINLTSAEAWFGYLIIPLLLAAAAAFIAGYEGNVYGSSQSGPGGVIFGGLLALSVVGGIILFVCSWAMWNHGDYQTQILRTTPATAQAKATLPKLDADDAPLVSEDMAKRVANKLVARMGQIGSSFHLSRLYKEIVNGRLVWVGYLEYDGFFSWHKFDGTPGYVVVSATDPNDAHLVTKVNGHKIAMKYLDSAWFGDNAERLLWSKGDRNTLIGDPVPQLDDDGVPYLVAPVYRKTIGVVGGSEVSGLFTLNTLTGEVKHYTLDAKKRSGNLMAEANKTTSSIPSWVSRIQPEDMVLDQINNAGRYIHGWWNPSHSSEYQADVSGTSRQGGNDSTHESTARDGTLQLVLGDDGRLYWYAGLKSVGGDDGVIGYILVDAVTKEVSRYDVAGVSEAAVRNAAEGKIPQYHYQATTPLPFYVGGQPTYIMALRDDSGIARDYAMVSMKDYQILSVDTTLKATLRGYETALMRQGVGEGVVQATRDNHSNSVEGFVERVAILTHNGESRLLLAVCPAEASQGSGADGGVALGHQVSCGTKAVIVGGSVSSLSPDWAALTQAGDRVSIAYHEPSGGGVGMIDTIVNKNLPKASAKAAAKEVSVAPSELPDGKAAN